METNRGRPTQPAPTTPAEWRVLELVQAGAPDAEIAVRLGISIAAVRGHVSNLLTLAELEDRQQLARWKPKAVRRAGRPRPGLRSWKLLTVVVGAGLVVVVAAFLLRTGDGEEPAATNAEAPAATTPRSTVIAGRTMLDLGPLFVTADGANAVKSTEARETLLVVELAQPNVSLALNGLIEWSLSWPSGARGLISLDPYQRIAIEMYAATDATTFVPNTDAPTIGLRSIEVSSRNAERPQVLLWAGDRHAEIGPDGHLYIKDGPAETEAVIAFDTGERLDVSRAAKLGPLDRAWTLCASPEAASCFVIAYYGKGPVRAPFAGVFRCRGDGVDELTGSALRLELRHLNAGQADLPCGPPGRPPRDVRSGDPLFISTHTLVTAFGADGQPVSLVVAKDGALYAGDIPRRFGCPCRSGN